MTETRMLADKWTDRDHYELREVADPDELSIRAAIQQLDQQRHQIVCFERGTDNLLIGGGLDALVVSATVDPHGGDFAS